MSNIPEGYTKLAVTGYSNMGNEYDPEKTYYKYNTVYYDGSTYVIIKDGIQGITPTNDGENYVFLAKGFPGDAESVTADDKYDLTQETQNPSGTSNRKTPLQTWLNSAANFIVGKLVHTDAFQDVLKQYIVNNGTTNQEGFALDGRQANPNIEGTLAYEVSQLTNGLDAIGQVLPDNISSFAELFAQNPDYNRFKCVSIFYTHPLAPNRNSAIAFFTHDRGMAIDAGGHLFWSTLDVDGWQSPT